LAIMRSAVVSALISAAVADTLLPSDARMTYIGRFSPAGSTSGIATPSVDTTEAESDVKYFGWSGAQMACRFKGTSVSAQLMGGKVAGRFLAIVDGKQQTPFVISSGTMKGYTLAQGLSDAEHEVVLWKLTEDFEQKKAKGADAFGGFNAAAFLDAPAPKNRRLEFIGDSDTAGWCADGSKKGGDAYTLENTHQTWAVRLAQDLGADFVAEAVSGIGAYNSKVAGGIIQDYLPNTLPFDSSEAWDVSRQQTPDAVVILIGPNDNKPSSSGFKTAYRQLMDDVVSMYKHASSPPKIIHVCGGSINGFDPCDSIQEVNTEFNKGRSDGFQSFYTSITKATWKTINNNKKYQGCDSHYGPKGHETLKNEILPQVRNIMGWSEVSDVLV